MTRSFLRVSLVLALLGFATTSAGAVTLVNGSTQGRYNSSIGTLLDGTSAVFPGANVCCGDPSIDVPAGSPPNLSAAAAVLGGWLTTPATPGASWSAPQAIPATWTVNHETAIIYELDGGAGGLTGVTASFGVDNGIFVWLNGTFLGGHLRPGGVSLGEFVLNIGAVGAGTNYLQVLREDHGGLTGYAVLVTGDVAPVPLPATFPLLAAGIAGLGVVARKRRTARA